MIFKNYYITCFGYYKKIVCALKRRNDHKKHATLNSVFELTFFVFNQKRYSKVLGFNRFPSVTAETKQHGYQILSQSRPD